MTNEQRENLHKLADYLDSGELLAGFNMGYYECNSVGCAIGHGPRAGIPIQCRETWFRYSMRVFGFVPGTLNWAYCFSSSWKMYDNTPEGAAKRIRAVLSGEETKVPWVNSHE